MNKYKYCDHEPDVQAWYISSYYTGQPTVTYGRLCASCLKELNRDSRVLDTDEKLAQWWKENTR